VGADLTAEINARGRGRYKRGHLLRKPISLGAIAFCNRDLHEMSDDEVINLLGRALRPIERDRAWWMT
jgi:hypothetical protein